jgi:hypothetical protein
MELATQDRLSHQYQQELKVASDHKLPPPHTSNKLLFDNMILLHTANDRRDTIRNTQQKIASVQDTVEFREKRSNRKITQILFDDPVFPLIFRLIRLK